MILYTAVAVAGFTLGAATVLAALYLGYGADCR